MRLCEDFVREIAHALSFAVRIEVERERRTLTAIHRSVESLIVALPDAVGSVHGA